MRPFQLILVGIFLAMGVGGLLVFAFFKGWLGDANKYGNQVIIWGTLDDAPFSQTIEKIKQTDDDFHVVQYVQKDPRTFESDLVNALANGNGPDLIIVSQDMLLANRARIYPIPYASFPLRTFKDSYIDGAEIFLLSDGVYGMPIAVDPMVLYWNKDIFATKGLAAPPRTWTELLAVTLPAIIERDFAYNITRAAISMGEYANIRNAKDILSLLFLQAGSIMVTDIGDGRLMADIDRTQSTGVSPAQMALRFYTEFSNPVKTSYTWNRSMPQDRDEFLAQDLAMYVGFSSEVKDIRRGNPNLNFDVAEVPQSADATLKKGYGTFYAMAPVRASKNLNGAIAALYVLTTQGLTENYAHGLGLGTVFRASHQTPPADPFFAVVEKASLIAHGWLDPNQSASDNIFKQMVEDVTSGRLEVSSAVGDANGRLRLLLPQ